MAVDGLVRASKTEVSVQSIQKYLKVNELEKIVLVPDYNSIRQGKTISGNGEDNPKKDLLFRFTKKLSKKNRAKNIASIIENANQYLRDLHSAMPDSIIPFVGVNTNSPDYLAKLNALFSEWKFMGIHLPNHLNETDLITPEIYDLYRWISNNNLNLIIHLSSVKDIYSIQKIVRDFRSVKFVVQHMIGLEKFDPCMAGLNNIYFDISPLYAISDYRFKKALELFTPRHIVYGSSYPYGLDNIQQQKERLQKLVKDDYKLNLIMGGNWERILASQCNNI